MKKTIIILIVIVLIALAWFAPLIIKRVSLNGGDLVAAVSSSNTPKIVSIALKPEVANAGDQVTVTWTSQNISKFYVQLLRQGNDGQFYPITTKDITSKNQTTPATLKSSSDVALQLQPLTLSGKRTDGFLAKTRGNTRLKFTFLTKSVSFEVPKFAIGTDVMKLKVRVYDADKTTVVKDSNIVTVAKYK